MPSVSKKQHNFMNAIAHNKAFAKKVGIPQSVGQEFSKADKGKTFKQGGIMAKKEMHSEKSEMKMDKAQDKAMIKKAFRQHDIQEHKGGKGTKLALKKGGSAMCGVKKMAVGGSTGTFNSTGNNQYAPAMQTGAIGGLDQLNQSIGTIQNALGGAPKNVGESTQMYKRGGKVKKMADGGMPIDPRAVAMAQKQAAMAKGAKRGMPMARPQAPQMAGMPQGKPMVGRMPPQANMPVPTMKKGGMTKMGAVKTRPGNINGVAKTGLTKGKMVKMAVGGSVGSASKRADGCAVRGKTKGRMV
jgi:hypothetical protein